MELFSSLFIFVLVVYFTTRWREMKYTEATFCWIIELAPVAGGSGGPSVYDLIAYFIFKSLEILHILRHKVGSKTFSNTFSLMSMDSLSEVLELAH